MGLKSLFTRKKKTTTTESEPPQTTIEETPLSVQSPSVNDRSSTRTQIEELELVFNIFDINGDGKISASELGQIMENLGQPSTEEELEKMILEADKDGDGFIDLHEFIELNTHHGVDALESVKDAFKLFDIDGNGSISAEELHKVLKSLGERCSVAECMNMISGVDMDGDGLISFDEFKVMMDANGSMFGDKDKSVAVVINN